MREFVCFNESVTLASEAARCVVEVMAFFVCVWSEGKLGLEATMSYRRGSTLAETAKATNSEVQSWPVPDKEWPNKIEIAIHSFVD